jgi:basic membrane lipoprotein Med (substrate-binding protein (PBP1-ABC) superfamily)
MKRLLLGVLAMMALLVGCTGGGEGETVTKIEPELRGSKVEGTLKVALLTPGNVNDSGWSAIANRGLEAIKKELGAETSQQVTKDAAIKDAMRSYGQDGYHLVIGHGFEYNEPAVEVAKDFGKTIFVSSSGGGSSANAGAFRFYLEEGFYLAGMIAGKMSKTGKVAMIGGPDVPSIRSTFKAFEAGAKESNPAVVVITKFTGKNDDVAAAKQATLQAIDEGADILIHQTNSAVTGFVSACEEKKVWAFGANEDQNKLSKQIIASAVIAAEKPFVALAKRVQEGTYKGGIELAGMKDGAIDFVFNPESTLVVDPDVKKSVTALMLAMSEEKFKAPKDEF